MIDDDACLTTSFFMRERNRSYIVHRITEFVCMPLQIFIYCFVLEQ